MKVLIADPFPEPALEILVSAQIMVDACKTSPKEGDLERIIGAYDGLIVGNTTGVTRGVIDKGTRLKVIGRAGIEIDNIDVMAATERGIIVMNTPQALVPGMESQNDTAHEIARQVVDFFLNGVIRNSVNVPPVSVEAVRRISPYLNLSEKLGSFVARITDFPIKDVLIRYNGEISHMETAILTNGILKGILQDQGEGVNYVNALALAKSRAIEVQQTTMDDGGDFASLLVIRVKGDTGENTVQGTLFGKKEPRLIKVNDIYVEADLKGRLLFIYTYDKPGVIASIGNVFLIRAINIGGMYFGRESVGGLAVLLLNLDCEVEQNVIREVQSLPNIVSVKKIDLG